MGSWTGYVLCNAPDVTSDEEEIPQGVQRGNSVGRLIVELCRRDSLWSHSTAMLLQLTPKGRQRYRTTGPRVVFTAWRTSRCSPARAVDGRILATRGAGGAT